MKATRDRKGDYRTVRVSLTRQQATALMEAATEMVDFLDMSATQRRSTVGGGKAIRDTMARMGMEKKEW